MPRSLDSMLGSSIIAKDGEIGKAYNVFFDDRSWAVRYLVVETGSWFTRRKVLFSPAVLGRPDGSKKAIPVQLTEEQVLGSPDVDADRPVARQQELAMSRRYGWPDNLGLELFPSSPWTEASAPATERPRRGEIHTFGARKSLPATKWMPATDHSGPSRTSSLTTSNGKFSTSW
jgi:hypothetical protein